MVAGFRCTTGRRRMRHCVTERAAHCQEPERDLSVPPSDAAAECALLAMCELYPEQVGTLRLEGLLVFPEHQEIWRAMCRVRMRSPGLDVTEFWLATLHELHTKRCRDERPHEHERWGCDGFRVLRVLDFGEHANPKDITYWLARLERVRDARRLISLAQEQAEKAWRLDVDGALAAASRSLSVRAPVPVWKRERG